MPTLREAGLRHSRYYLLVLATLPDLRTSDAVGSHVAREILEENWDQIQHGQRWTAEHASKDQEAADMCRLYAATGAPFLNLTQRWEERILWTEAALPVVRKFNDTDLECALLSDLGAAYTNHGDMTKGMECYEQALGMARELNKKAIEGMVLGNIGLAHLELGNPAEAIGWLEQAIEMAQASGNMGEGAGDIDSLGSAYEGLGQMEEAVKQYKRAAKLHREYSNKYWEANSLRHLGSAYQALGKGKQAVTCLRRAVFLYFETARVEAAVATLEHLWNLHMGAGNSLAARKLCEKYLSKAAIMDDHATTARVLNLLGMARAESELAAEAISAHEGALTMARRLGNRGEEKSALWDLGLCYKKVGEYQKAAEMSTLAVTLAQELGDRYAEAACLCNLGLAYAGMGEMGAAIQRYQKALAVATEIQDKGWQGNALCNWSWALIALGQYEEALVYGAAALGFFDEIESPNLPKALQAMTTAYNSLPEEQRPTLEEILKVLSGSN